MERRVDPEDGEAVTLKELLLKYKETYSQADIEAYFRDDCKALPKPTAEEPSSKQAESCAIDGLSDWLQELELEEYLEDVQEWCVENGAVLLEEVQDNWDDILTELKMKTAKEQLPGKRVNVQVLFGKWQGSYVALVLDVTSDGIRVRHEEDGFEETLPLDALGGGKYRLEPVESDEEGD
eukprot:TRINITY_DN103500_c0_g1_i1.p1 TRINITY_DN103500_c0_g1~~TRINITY_DN103500_c0_g1_i1.p1  ORF type:complete len:180 (-),score=64.64 TRINITY_DN103500_c0_g1_i1:43-582(-)